MMKRTPTPIKAIETPRRMPFSWQGSILFKDFIPYFFLGF